MAEQFLGSPGTSLVRRGMGRVARGARSASLAVCILWLHLSRQSQSVWSMRTTERQRSVENVYQQSPMERSRRETSSSRGATIRIYWCVPAKGFFGKEKRDYRVQTVCNAPGVMQRRSRQNRHDLSRCCGACNTRGTAERTRIGEKNWPPWRGSCRSKSQWTSPTLQLQEAILWIRYKCA